jgi:hypothetical protein
VKPVFLLGCYGCIFHGTGIRPIFVKKIRNFGGVGVYTTTPNPLTVCHWFNMTVTANPLQAWTFPKVTGSLTLPDFKTISI